MTRSGTFKDHIGQAFSEAVENGRDAERLRILVLWCRTRVKRKCYADYIDRCLADLSILDPIPEMQGTITNGMPPTSPVETPNG